MLVAPFPEIALPIDLIYFSLSFLLPRFFWLTSISNPPSTADARYSPSESGKEQNERRKEIGQQQQDRDEQVLAQEPPAGMDCEDIRGDTATAEMEEVSKRRLSRLINVNGGLGEVRGAGRGREFGDWGKAGREQVGRGREVEGVKYLN